jgi:tripartite-type tricarboxylate transporter receptor subunit TctC
MLRSKKRPLGRVILVFALLIGVSLPVISPAAFGAEKFPTEPFTYIVPFSPGGTTDLQARVFEKFWKENFGVPMAVEYMSGGGGQVGWDALVRRKADGYTVAGNNLPHIVMQPIFRDTIFTTEDHIKGAIAGLVTDPEMITVLQKSRFQNIHQLIEYARKNPGAVTAGVVGKFTGDWIGLKLFEEITNTKFAEVIFPGSAPQGVSLLGGHIDVMFGNTGDVITLGPENVRVLAVGAKEVPKILQPYLDQVDAPPAHTEGIQWFAAIHRGLVAVPGTAQAHIDFVCEKIDQIAATPAYAEAMDKAGLPAYYRPRKQYQEFIRQEKEQMIGILEKLGYIKVESGKIVVKKR